MHNFAVSRCSGIREVVDSRVVFLLAYGWRFLCEAAGPADVELLGFCELLKKKYYSEKTRTHGILRILHGYVHHWFVFRVLTH